MMADVEKRVWLAWLLDFYGPLLTEHRLSVMRLYCEEDMSVSEIAGQLSITRQGAHDVIDKAARQLEGYESKLGLLMRYRALIAEAENCKAELAKITSAEYGEALTAAHRAIDNILSIER